MNIAELQKEAYECAVEKGWHENDELGPDGKPTARQKLAWLALVTDELDESDAECRVMYTDSGGKPCGIAIEYADAIIRMADAASAIGYELVCLECADDISAERSALVSDIRHGTDDAVRWSRLMRSIVESALSKFGSTSLYAAINAKTAYNRTRTHRHGGKLA